MRHFLHLPGAPRPLPSRVATGSVVALLVAITRSAQRLAPANPRAPRRAVLVAAVAMPTDAHLLGAASAIEQPIAPLARPHAPRTQRWTTPRNAGIKEARTRPCAARACRRPGVLPGTLPGPSLIRRPDGSIAQPAPHGMQNAGVTRLRARLQQCRGSAPIKPTRTTRRAILGTLRGKPQNPADSDPR
jgi:hypothetical protein